MAKYLDTSQISSELMQLLKEAKEKIILVTYSMQVNEQIQDRLKTRSKLGTLSEISIIFGNTKLNEKEIGWMKEIDYLRIFQKKNLHAKCYINENKAIISSMNLYDYSQTKNIEMGILINRETDKEAYDKMMEDINDLKINGDKIKIEDLIKSTSDSSKEISSTESEQKVLDTSVNLTYSQQIQKYLLEDLRKHLSHEYKQKSEIILSNNEIVSIITSSHISQDNLVNLLRNRKKAEQLSEPIIQILRESEYYTVGEVLNTRFQKDDFSYDQIKMRSLHDNFVRWYDTKQELPTKGSLVAVSLNKNWFNQYMNLEKTESDTDWDSKTFMDYSNSVYRSTKELSDLTSLSSREINSILVDSDLMIKEGTDWYATKKGDKFGALQKEGRYGKFILWPEEIIEHFELK